VVRGKFAARLIALSGSFVGAATAHAAEATAQPPCDTTQTAVLDVTLPGRPFAAISSPDSCVVFASLIGRNGERGQGAIAALRRSDGKLSALGAASLDDPPAGLALTHDGSLLVAAAGDGATFIDTARLASGAGGAVLGHLSDGGQFATYVAITPDDRYLFISDEHSESISVVDIGKARTSGFGRDAVIGKIPVGQAPVGLAVSSDGRTLYSTSEVIPQRSWPGECTESNGKRHPGGALAVIDVARAETDPANAVLRRVPAACSPVRVVLSPAGDRLYVTARGSDALLVFDPGKLLAGDSDALLASVAVGTAPVGVATSADGKDILVADSNRFTSAGREDNQVLTVIDAGKIGGGSDPIIGTIEVGGFPRELHLTADGKTLLVTNFGSKSIILIDAGNLPIKPPKP
jgi:YVTN family beta-propeller protein